MASEVRAQAFSWEDGVPALRLFTFEGVPVPYEIEDGSWVFPQESADRLKLTLIHYMYMPDLFYEFQQVNDAAWRTVLRASLNVARAENQRKLTAVAAEGNKGWPTWQVVLVVTGGAIIAAALGIGVGAAIVAF